MESVEKELQEEDNEKTNLIIRAKKIQTEQAYINKIMRRFMHSRPDVAFKIISNDKIIYKLFQNYVKKLQTSGKRCACESDPDHVEKLRRKTPKK